MSFAETWFEQDSVAEITGYNSLHASRNEDKIGGGVSIYMSWDFKSVLLSDISFVSDVIKICSVKITVGNNSLYVLGIFHPLDKAKLPNFDVILSVVLSRFYANDCVFFIGVLNLDTISPSNDEV